MRSLAYDTQQALAYPMIVVLHRERSEKLARKFVEALHEQRPELMEPWPEMPAEDQEYVIRGFDSLIQDGLIGERR